jgi:ABC-type Zn uptake system ZnuABC Zn-binding protein ZnuA
MKGPENVHNVMAKPTEMLKLNQADLFVHGGLDAEPWRDNLLKGARNPRVMPGKPGNVDMSAGVELLDVPTGKIDRSMGDVHAYGNPHYHLSPANAMRMTATLSRAMSAADAKNADAYKQNATKLVNDLADTHKALREELKPLTGLKVVTFHPAWTYFAESFGLTIAGTIEPKPGITPSPAQVRDLVEKMKTEGVKVVIVETYSDQDLAASVAQRAGATLVRLPDHVLGTPEADTYPNLFRHDVHKIIEAAGAR